jgi:hypothetical protein
MIGAMLIQGIQLAPLRNNEPPAHCWGIIASIASRVVRRNDPPVTQARSS